MPAMIIRFYQGWFQMLLIDLPLFIACTFSISSSTWSRKKSSIPKTWCKTFLYLPFLMALGHRPHRHQHQGRHGSPLRHQKRLRAHAEIPRAKEGRKVAGRESIASASASCPGSSSPSAPTSPVTIWYALSNENYFTVPFLLLFVFGYWYTGLLSLLQGRFERWRTGANFDESTPKPFPVGV